jgi:hypothetical protein
MSVPSTPEPQKIPVSQIAFMESNYPSAKNVEAAPKDFQTIGTQMSEWRT